MQVATAAACSLLVLLRWPAEGQADFGGAQAREVFRLFGYGLLTPVPYQLLQGQSWGGALAVATWLRSVSPLPAVMEVLGDGDVGGQGLVAVAGNPLRYAVMALVSTALFLAGTVARLKPTLFDR